MLSQRGKPLLVHDGYSFGIQYIRKDKKYWQCNLSRKYNCKARVTTTDTGEIIVTNNEHCHTEIRQHLKKDYKNKILMSLNSGNASNNHGGRHANGANPAEANERPMATNTKPEPNSDSANPESNNNNNKNSSNEQAALAIVGNESHVDWLPKKEPV